MRMDVRPRAASDLLLRACPSKTSRNVRTKPRVNLDFGVSFPEAISKVPRRTLCNTVNNTALKLPERATLTTWLEQNLLGRSGPHRQVGQSDHPSCKMEDDLCASLMTSAPGARITSNERSFHDRDDTTRKCTGIYDLSTYAKKCYSDLSPVTSHNSRCYPRPDAMSLNAKRRPKTLTRRPMPLYSGACRSPVGRSRHHCLD